ncbi:MAG TPA: hypothetical protein VFC82_02590 [Actinomycetaceae bacterium]|nr:hypothetical protein [Actinomycetaceae bacterium]
MGRFVVWVRSWWFRDRAQPSLGVCHACAAPLELCRSCEGAWAARRCRHCAGGLVCTTHQNHWWISSFFVTAATISEGNQP